jgi:hypothetical protein
MEISPGVEIIWNMAGGETRAARMKEIEPDHFFCGLLKFAEMNEGEIQTDQVPQLVIQALKTELEQLRKVLKDKAINTTNVRREIRRVVGQGFLRPAEGEALHRSEASRQLFEQATRSAVQNRGIVDAVILLKTLLARPTYAMSQVLGKTAGAEDDGKAEEPAVDLPPNRYVQELTPGAAEKPAPDRQAAAPGIQAAETQPQVQVLALALRRPSVKPICLICTAKSDVPGLLQRAAQKERPAIQILQVNTADLLKGVKNPGTILDNIGEVLNRANGAANLFVFFDTSGLKVEKVALLLRSLKQVIEAPGIRLVFAIQVNQFNQVIDELQLDGQFQEIWLHDLKEPRIPHQL